MMGTWMAYALAVSGVVMAAGLGLERALERLDRPTRWVWLSAMLVGVMVPVAALLRAPLPAAPLASGSGLGVGDVALLGLASVAEPAAAPRMTVDGVLLLGWGAASLLVTLGLLWSVGSLARTRRGWRRARVEGVRVWVSERTGPAVVGFLSPAIVLPGWVLEWDPALRRLIVAHEREHVRAGDGRLLLAGLLLLCAAPWNVMLWWQWRRLRQAVETDCDRRVLRSEPDVRRYGRLLLEVADRTRRHALPMAAFAESRSFLERRIRMMTNRQARNRLGWTVALVGALALTPALLLALPAPAPVGVGGVTAAVARWADQIVLRDEIFPRPAPMIARAVRVTPPRAPTSSFLHGDTAMLEIARSASRGASKDTVPVRERVYSVLMLDQKPDITNKSQVQSMLSRFYPRMLQDAGIGGTTVMSFVVTPEGTVDPSSIQVVSATHEQFSEASRKIVEKFIFTPGLYHGKAVRTLIQMPITWAPNTSRPVEGTAYGAGGAAGGAEGGGAHLSSPVLLAIREIVMKSYPELMRSTTGTRKILGVVVHPDGRIKHMELSNGYFQPDGRAALTFDSESSRGGRTFGETPAAIRHVEIMTSPDLATIAKDLNSVIWVTLKE